MGPEQMHYEEEEVANEILQYLIDNPEAEDTSKGILEWWLLERTVIRQQYLVEAALNMLVDKDFLIKNKRSDSQTSYRINPLKREEIILKLEQRS